MTFVRKATSSNGNEVSSYRYSSQDAVSRFVDDSAEKIVYTADGSHYRVLESETYYWSLLGSYSALLGLQGELLRPIL